MLEHARCLSMPLKHAEVCLSALEHAIFPFSTMLKHAIVECLSMLEHAPAVTHPHLFKVFIDLNFTELVSLVLRAEQVAALPIES